MGRNATRMRGILPLESTSSKMGKEGSTLWTNRGALIERRVVKQALFLKILVAATCLSGCAQIPGAEGALSTEESCSEFTAILELENEDVVTDGAADQVGEQMTLLADKASTVVREDIKLTADMSSGVYGTAGEVSKDKELQESYQAALARLGRVCDVDWLKGP